MKAILSGVIFSAAMMRSPSFSRSSSSTTTTNSPRCTASIALSTVSNVILSSSSLVALTSLCFAHRAVQEPLDVLGEDVTFEIHGFAGGAGPERCHGQRVRDDRDAEAVVVRRGNGEADAVHGDRALVHDVAHNFGRRVETHERRAVGLLLAGAHGAGAVDVTLHEVAAEPVGQPQRPLEVDGVAGGELAERRAAQCLDDVVGGPPPVADVHRREAAPVDGDRRAERRVLEHGRRVDLDARPVGVRDDRAYPAQLLDDPREHQAAISYSSRTSGPRRVTSTSWKRSAPWIETGPGNAKAGTPS